MEHNAQDTRKISVRYGAFQCTVEGYDDNVAVIKDLAVWFRDMGTAPPQEATGADVFEEDDIAEADLSPQLADDTPTGETAAQRLARLRGITSEPTAQPDLTVHPEPKAPRAPTAEIDVDRLMATAEAKLDEPEGSDRRAAFTHIRAAVAAKQADDTLAETDTSDRRAAYQADLQQAVVSEPKHPAPLRLAASQRIDTPAKGNFARFASQHNATSLPDLQEAAAAWLTLPEQGADFTRPQLMALLREVPSARFSREDGLRVFGQLLRTGKITKTDNGRYRASTDSRFLPEKAREVG